MDKQWHEDYQKKYDELAPKTVKEKGRAHDKAVEYARKQAEKRKQNRG